MIRKGGKDDGYYIRLWGSFSGEEGGLASLNLRYPQLSVLKARSGVFG